MQTIMRTVSQKRVMQVQVIKQATAAQELLVGEGWEPLESNEPNILRFEVQADDQQLADALFALMKNGFSVCNFTEVPADLEDVFMSLTK